MSGMIALAYAVAACVSFRLTARWAASDFRRIDTLDDDDHVFIVIFCGFFGGVLWPLGLPLIFLLSSQGRSRRKQRRSFVARFGEWATK